MSIRRHWLWSSYVEFQRSHGLPAVEAIARLQEVYPDLPVETIIRAEGDMSKTLEQLANAPLPDLGTQSQQSQGSSNGQGQTQAPAVDPNDINAAIRARATRNVVTLTLPRDAIAGQQGQGEQQEPDPFIHNRLAERYGQRG